MGTAHLSCQLSCQMRRSARGIDSRHVRKLMGRGTSERRRVRYDSGGRQAIVAKLFAQRELRKLAGRRMRQLVDEYDIVRKPPFSDLAIEEAKHGLAGEPGILLLDNDQEGAFIPPRVAYA